jgi:hypothetical protein
VSRNPPLTRHLGHLTRVGHPVAHSRDAAAHIARAAARLLAGATALVAVRAGLLTAQSAQGVPNSHQLPASQLEVLGLRRWTVQMLRDSLARRVPGATLESDACQVLLATPCTSPTPW